jgi:hypothetical protein
LEENEEGVKSDPKVEEEELKVVLFKLDIVVGLDILEGVKSDPKVEEEELEVVLFKLDIVVCLDILEVLLFKLVIVVSDILELLY